MRKKHLIWFLTFLFLSSLLTFSSPARAAGDPSSAILAQNDEQNSDITSEQSVIKDIEVNQGISFRKDIGTGALSLMEKLVAGKDTVILVRLNNRTLVDENGGSQTLEVYYNDELLTTLSPSPVIGPATVLTFIPNSRNEVNNWAAGSYRFAAKINDAQLSREVVFQPRRTLNILALPVKANYGGEVREVTGTWKTAGSYTSRVYPVAGNSFNWVLGQELDASDDSFDLTTDDGQKNLWTALTNQQVKDEYGRDKYDLIVGFVRDRQGADGTLQGYTYGRPANIVTESDEDMMATVAHEIAHIYEVGDEYGGGSINMPVNPAPLGMTGTDWTSSEEITADNQYFIPYSKPGDGSSIEKEIPYEFGKRGQLPEMVSFMGSGSSQAEYWITSPIWEKLYDSFAPSEGELETSNRHSLAEENSLRVVEVYAWISRNDTVDASQPWVAYQMQERFYEPQTSGAYSIKALDSNGATLAQQYFNLRFQSTSNPPRILQEAPVEGLEVPFPEGTAKFVFQKGDQVIGEKLVSAHAPQVSITSPQNGQTIADDTTCITWTGSDADDDPLSYDVLYSNNGEDWIALAYELSETSYTDNFAELPGGSGAQIKITASDGVNTSEAVCGNLAVPVKAPEIYFYEPENGESATYYKYEEILLEAEAYDLQDEYLDDDCLIWKENGTELGRGSYIFLEDMAPGVHQISLTARNSLAKETTQTLQITIIDAEPPSDYFRPFKDEVPEVPADKAWRISLSKPADRAMVNSENISITDYDTDEECQLDFSFENNDRVIVVTPKAAFNAGGAYTLWIKDLKSTDGKDLKTRQYLDFSINP